MVLSLELIIIVQTIIIFVIAIYASKSKKSIISYYKSKYSGISDIEKEIKKSSELKNKIDQTIEILQIKYKDKNIVFEKIIKIEDLENSYKEKKKIFDNLVKEAAIYDETIQLAELGFYKPHFDYDTSEKYKEQLIQSKRMQREMVSNKTAIYCNKDWAVENSIVKGRTFINRGIRLTARAFNNECDAAMIKIRWNNAESIQMRIHKAYKAINKLNKSISIVISNEYFQLKQKELMLTHEYKEKKQEEKEEQSEIRRQMREELRLDKEIHKAIKDEEKYQGLLEKAKIDAEKLMGSKLEKLKEKMALLDKELKAAKIKSERAKSMAQQTKLGHVYIVSNIGSFGEGVYKIGMTRRLEPLDRVKELGDASVPFLFDVHAMIYAEDAPALEKSLHKVFDTDRMNLINYRKEFFKVSLDDIKLQVGKILPDAEFIETAEARHYRETKAILEQRVRQMEKKSIQMEFPDFI